MAKKKSFVCDKCKRTANCDPFIFVPFIRRDDIHEISPERLPRRIKNIGLKKYCKECAEKIADFILEDWHDLQREPDQSINTTAREETGHKSAGDHPQSADTIRRG